jgi:hypothetical protein
MMLWWILVKEPIYKEPPPREPFTLTLQIKASKKKIIHKRRLK